MPHPLFSVFGVELEYMVVDRETLAVRPIVDTLLREVARLPGASVESESEPGWPDEIALESRDDATRDDLRSGQTPNPSSNGQGISLGNELTAHVLEFKVSEPAKTLRGLSHSFHAAAQSLNPVFEKHGVMLLPGGMHPTMDPMREMKLWPHGNKEVYEAFNRIFDCRGHGWANLQACHINLPFGEADLDDPMGEFGRLHAAIRTLLPIMPALSAASPMMDGRVTGLLDNRLEVYRTNSAKIPPATGKVIPERVFTKRAYEQGIFQKIYDAYAPHDPGGLLRDEWANSRGCIARFSRSAIEIRVLDVQECPRSDLAIAQAIVSVLRAMCAGNGFDIGALQRLEVEPMHAILLTTIREAERGVISDSTYLSSLGVKARSCTSGELWRELLSRTSVSDPDSGTWLPIIDFILSQGPLARRMMRAVGKDVNPRSVATALKRLAGCLSSNSPFVP